MALSLLLLCACEKRIELTDSKVTYEGSRLIYEGKSFSGTVIQKFAALAVTRETTYSEGEIDGEERDVYDNGQTAALRHYEQGKKVGIHEGWYRDGKRRFHHEYADDRFHGEYWEWFQSGGVFTYARYEKGEAIGRKMWREDGTIYLNYVFPAGRAFCTPGAKLCRQVRG